MLDHLRTMNEGHLSERYDNTNLAARVASYELAYKMQASAPEAVDVDKGTSIHQRLIRHGWNKY